MIIKVIRSFFSGLDNTSRNVFIFLFLCVLLTYGHSLNNPFIWDDNTLIVNNYDIDNLGNMLAMPLYKDAELKYYRPFQMLTYFLDYKIWKFKPFGYHLVNLILHGINSFLIYVVIKRLSQNWVIGFISSIMFAVNPIFVTSVSYISARADLLVLLFILLSFEMLMEFLRNYRPSYYLWSLVLFSLALLSKEAAILTIFLFITYFIVYARNTNKDTVFYCLFGYALVLFFYFLIRNQTFNVTYLPKFNAALYYLLSINTLKMFFLYMVLFFFPFHPHFGRTISMSVSILEPLVIASVLFFSLVCFLLYRSYKLNKVVCFGLCWFMISTIALSMFDYLFGRQSNEVIMPENNLYITSIGLLCVFGYAVYIFFKKRSKQLLKWLLISVYFFYFCIVTIDTNRLWADKIIFYENILRYTKNSTFSYLIYTNLGMEYNKKNNFDKAIDCYNNVLKIKEEAPIYHNLGNVYFAKGNLNKAKEQYLRAIRLNPNLAISYVALGLIFIRENRFDESEEMFKNALKIDPSDQHIQGIIRKLIKGK